ncbi:unnamed protein product [Blumeria hordei]|uniref:Uncharacterized protein n=1 Tax=Blumeria hordei TaxID=2867405 RepID=A0A383UQI0_BLUHO|nr:unnamed protein product [Blumeria hordei]
MYGFGQSRAQYVCHFTTHVTQQTHIALSSHVKSCEMSHYLYLIGG